MNLTSVLLVLLILSILFLVREVRGLLKEVKDIKNIMELPSWSSKNYDERLSHVAKKVSEVVNAPIKQEDRNMKCLGLFVEYEGILEERRNYFTNLKDIVRKDN